YAYFGQLLITTAPFTGFVVYAILIAVSRWRTNAQLRTILLSIASIFVPLLFIGNKQQHYLLPLMPPLMLLTGVILDAGVAGCFPGSTTTLKSIAIATALVLAAGGAAIPLTDKLQHRPITIPIIALSLIVFLASLLILPV